MIQRWVRFWDRREAPYSLALVRILLGAVVLFDLLEAGYFHVVTLLFAPTPSGAGWDASGLPAPFVMRVFGASETTAHVTWWFAVVSCLLFTLGAAYRLASVALVFAMVELGACQPVRDGIDALLHIVLAVLAVSGAGEAWSVDAWLRRRDGKAPSSIPAWPRYLLFLQVIWVYVSAGHQRGHTWGPLGGFSAVGDVLGDPHFARFTPGSLAVLYPLTCFGTLLTMAFEVSSPLILLWTWFEGGPARGGRVGDFARRFHLRWVWLAAGASLHAGIALSMNLGIFPYGMLALYPVFFRPDEVKSLFVKITAGAREQPRVQSTA